MARSQNPLCEFTPNSQGTIAKLVVREQLIGPDGPITGGGGGVTYQTASNNGIVIAADVTDVLSIDGYAVAAGRSVLCQFTCNVRSLGPAQPSLVAEMYRFNGESEERIAICQLHYVADEVDDATVLLSGVGVADGDSVGWDYRVRLTVSPSVNPGVDDYTVENVVMLLTEVDTTP